MDLELKNGIGFISMSRIVDKNYTDCAVFGTTVSITATKDSRKKIAVKVIVRGDPHKNISEVTFSEVEVDGGKLYREVELVTKKTNMGKLFGETVYSPDTSDELLLIVKFFVTATDEEIRLIREVIDPKAKLLPR